MEDRFDEKLRNRISNASVKAPEGLFESIYAEHKKDDKRKKGIWFWYVAASLIVLAMVTFITLRTGNEENLSPLLSENVDGNFDHIEEEGRYKASEITRASNKKEEIAAVHANDRSQVKSNNLHQKSLKQDQPSFASKAFNRKAVRANEKEQSPEESQVILTKTDSKALNEQKESTLINEVKAPIILAHTSSKQSEELNRTFPKEANEKKVPQINPDKLSSPALYPSGKTVIASFDDLKNVLGKRIAEGENVAFAYQNDEVNNKRRFRLKIRDFEVRGSL